MRIQILAYLLLFIFAPLRGHAADTHDPAIVAPEYPAKAAASCPNPSQLRELHQKLKEGKTLTPSEVDFLKSAAEGIKGCPAVFEKEDVLALMHWLQVLPCDPASFKGKVKILLLPENHKRPQIEVYQHYFEQAKAGHAMIGFEAGLEKNGEVALSSLNEEQSKRVRTNIDGLYPDLAIILDNHGTHYTADGKEIKSASEEKLALNLFNALVVGQETSEALLKKALENLTKQSASRGEIATKLVHAASKIVLDKSFSFKDFVKNRKERVAAFLTENRGKNSEKESEAALEGVVTEALSILTSEMATERFQFRNHGPILNLATLKRFDFTDMEIVETWRDRNIAHSALQMVCEAGRDGISEVAIHVGSNHVPGTYRNIASVLAALGRTDKVSIGVNTSSYKDPSQAFPEIPEKDKFRFEKG